MQFATRVVGLGRQFVGALIDWVIGLDRGSCDDAGGGPVRGWYVLAAFDRCDLSIAAWEFCGDTGCVERIGVLDADGDFHGHLCVIKAEFGEQGQRGMANGVVDGADCGFGVIEAVKVGADARFKDDALVRFGGHYAGSISKDTTMAALAMTV